MKVFPNELNVGDTVLVKGVLYRVRHNGTPSVWLDFVRVEARRVKDDFPCHLDVRTGIRLLKVTT